MRRRCAVDENRRGINPFFIGAEFLEYCVRKGYLEFVLDEEKRVHYYVTDAGMRELTGTFGFDLKKPCAYEHGAD